MKFLVEKRSLKGNLKFKLAHIEGRNSKNKDKKIYDLLITRLGKRKKTIMEETIETIIIRAQQNFDIVGDLNPVHVELEDNRILNILKRFKNVLYRVAPLGLLFPATITNDTRQVFITEKELNRMKKSILNGKMYDLIAIIDLDKIPNWTEIKGQSIWVNVSFKDQKERNNTNHLCFPFLTRSFNDLPSFSIYLQDGVNKKIEFNTGEKKISILNFQIEMFLQ